MNKEIQKDRKVNKMKLEVHISGEMHSRNKKTSSRKEEHRARYIHLNSGNEETQKIKRKTSTERDINTLLILSRRPRNPTKYHPRAKINPKVYPSSIEIMKCN